MATKFATVDDYMASLPQDVQRILQRVRKSVHKAAPGCDEKISYGIPTATLKGKPVVYFAGWKDHISLYPVPTVDEELDARLAPYRASKGTLKFPLQQPIPYDLVEQVTSQLLQERLQGAK